MVVILDTVNFTVLEITYNNQWRLTLHTDVRPVWCIKLWNVCWKMILTRKHDLVPICTSLSVFMRAFILTDELFKVKTPSVTKVEADNATFLVVFQSVLTPRKRYKIRHYIVDEIFITPWCSHISWSRYHTPITVSYLTQVAKSWSKSLIRMTIVSPILTLLICLLTQMWHGDYNRTVLIFLRRYNTYHTSKQPSTEAWPLAGCYRVQAKVFALQF